ncbi:extracellular solute-binding protein [Streptomyces sp. NBC_00623]|uniref:extracellular solute-binding protein n=1 Tax=Streptomyces sp. NBC_00623 TaxID=2975790 RepID=UPI0030E5C7E3
MRKSHLKPLAAVTGALALAATLSACGGSSAASDEKVVTVYSADGLKGENGDGWYDKVFKDFEKKTGIKVEYVEGGSGEMVQRAAREKSNTQADVLVTLPPFIQQADSKGLLTAYEPAGSDQVDGADKSSDSKWTSVVNNYFGFVYNGKEPAMEYLKKLQANNVGPSASTGKLAPKVDKGELLVANGDVQMNYAQSKDMPNLGIWFPAKSGSKPTTFALPYAAGLVSKAPHSANGKKLLDFMLSEQAQKDVSEVGGGFSARKDIEATDANAIELSKLMGGVEVFEPDWSDIGADLDGYVDAWKTATGS